jgi:UDP-N-acetylglucosamine diphosphorylase / glucose-1-phosphate thymidylyltransferase / UDP-N-acetylgalactosamine diphosphorylase / glucosamine-1-phosphate N-acetyltransferase / galactosamine-1-phosphate N-acetyltransferase
MHLASDYIAAFAGSPLIGFGKWAPWELTNNASEVLHQLLSHVDSSYRVAGTVAIHDTAIVEDQALIKGPAIVGPRCR